MAPQNTCENGRVVYDLKSAIRIYTVTGHPVRRSDKFRNFRKLMYRKNIRINELIYSQVNAKYCRMFLRSKHGNRRVEQ